MVVTEDMVNVSRRVGLCQAGPPITTTTSSQKTKKWSFTSWDLDKATTTSYIYPSEGLCSKLHTTSQNEKTRFCWVVGVHVFEEQRHRKVWDAAIWFISTSHFGQWSIPQDDWRCTGRVIFPQMRSNLQDEERSGEERKQEQGKVSRREENRSKVCARHFALLCMWQGRS